MQPPAPPPGASDDPGWRRDQSPYAPGGGAPTDAPGWPPRDAPPAYGPPVGYGPPPGYRPYGQPGSGPFGPATEHPQGTTILVLGILSLVVCQIMGPIAWVMGSKAQKEIDLDPARYTNRGNVVAGKILGIIASVLLIVSVVAWIAIIGLIIGAADN
jgi:hypothetical protein